MISVMQVLIAMLLVSPLVPMWAREYEECADVTEPDTFVSSQRSCSKYIFCDGDNSFEGECLGGNFFNEDEGICDDPENVDCDIVETDSVISIFDEEVNTSTVDKPVASNGVDVIPAPDVDNEGVLSVATEVPEIDSVPSGIVNMPETPKCPDTYGLENIRHIPHSESCSAFFTCYSGMAIPMLCPRSLFFNAETEKCEKQMPANCKLRYSVRVNCRKGVFDYMPHPQRCEYYHYCLNGYLMIMRCPYDFTWHYERRTCVHKSQSKCYLESSILAQQPVIYRSQNIIISSSRLSSVLWVRNR